jgi:hypothetical protein
MPTYLLLRSNKQSGPFSKEQLLQLGLKPYDLVWVEGKSAAWRYPSEVAELKDYAPVVEEQPYDRFYKKQNDEQKEEEPVAIFIKNENEYEQKKNEYEQPKEVIKEVIFEQYMPKKTVSVIMPKRAESLKPEPLKKEEPVFISQSTLAAVIPQKAVQPVNVDVETKYSQPLDEIKEMYVKQLQQRKYKTAQKKFIIQSLKKAAVFIAIIGSGVLIGFVIKPKNAVKKNVANPTVQNISPENAGGLSNTQTIPGNSNNTQTTKIPDFKRPANSNNELRSDPMITANNKTGPSEKKNANEEKDELVIDQQAVQTAANAAGSERHKNLRSGNAETDATVKSAAVTGDISKLVAVRANNFKLGAFGGFRNLQLTVTNDSKFTLDNVLVELQYLKLNDQPVKIEHIRFQSIEPNGSLTIQIPDNKRGAKLSYRIIKIDPKDLNANTAGL